MNRWVRRSVFSVMAVLVGLHTAIAAQPTPDSVILHIQEAIQASNLRGAEASLTQALQQDPQNGGLYNLRGIIHATRNEVKPAENDFARAVRLSPDLESAYLNLGRVSEILSSQDGGARNRAIAQFRLFLRRHPGSAPVKAQLARFLAEEKQFASSLRVLETMPPSSQDGGLALLLRSIDLAATGHVSEAEQSMAQLDQLPDLDESAVGSADVALAEANVPAVTARLLDLLARRSFTPDSWIQLESAYEHAGRYAEARTVAERRAALDPQNPDALLDLARLAQAQNDLKGALGYLAHARDLKPDSAPVHFFFGVVCIEMNLPLEAKKSLNKALELDGGNPWYNYARGSVELQGKSAWLAIPYFQKAMAARPSDPRFRFALGAAEFASAEYESAKKDLLAVARNKETTGGAEYILGRIEKVDANWAAAAEHFRKSIAAEPDYADSHAELGLALAHEDDFTAAKAEIDRALQLDAFSYPAHLSLLYVYQRTKNPLAAGQQEKLQQLEARRVETEELLVRTIKILR
jgi:tetratricopeptide (TPR) repeat protein